MSAPLDELLRALHKDGAPPFEWTLRHAPDGRLDALWKTASAEQMFQIYRHVDDPRRLTRAALACSALALPLLPPEMRAALARARRATWRWLRDESSRAAIVEAARRARATMDARLDVHYAHLATWHAICWPNREPGATCHVANYVVDAFAAARATCKSQLGAAAAERRCARRVRAVLPAPNLAMLTR